MKIKHAIGAISITAMLIITGCGGRISGIYKDTVGLTTYEFKPNGRVYINVFGATTAGEYNIDGQDILVTNPSGSLVFRRNGNDLEGPMGIKLEKQ